MEQAPTPTADNAPPLAYPTLKESWAVLGWSVLIPVVSVVVLLLALRVAAPVPAFPKTALLLGCTIGTNVLVVGWLRRRAGPARWLKVRWLAPREHWLAYGLLPLIVLANALVLSAQSFLHLPNWSAGTLAELARHPALALLLGCVGAPITEELLFRGVLLRGLLRNYRPAVAVGQSALLFGLIHFNPAQRLNACLMGLLLGWVYYRSQSLVLCCCLHGLHNTLALLGRLRPALSDERLLPPFLGTGGYLLLTLLAALVPAGSLWLLARHLPARPALL